MEPNPNRSRMENPNRSRIDPRADPNRSRMDPNRSRMDPNRSRMDPNRSRMDPPNRSRIDQNRSRSYYDNNRPPPPPPPPNPPPPPPQANYSFNINPPYSKNASYYGKAAPDPNWALNPNSNASFYERKDERKDGPPMWSGREEDLNQNKWKTPIKSEEKEEMNVEMQRLRENDLFRGETNRGFRKLFLANVLTIKPKVLWNNNEVEVTFHVYPGEFGESHKPINVPPIFEYKIERDCCSKYCLNADCRSINLVLRHLDGTEFLHLKKDFSCTFLCNNRGDLKVTYLENGDSTYFGRITNPFVCCDYELIINDENGSPKFLICADSCTCGMYCACSCKFCNRSKFFIKDLNFQVLGSFEIGTNYQLCDAMVNNDDFYIIRFPPYSKEKDRCMFLAAMLFIDLRYVGSKLS